MNPVDPWPYYFWGGASLLLSLLVWRGWRAGVVRQLAEALALACAGLTAYFVGGAVGAMLGSLGYPNWVLRAIGSLLVWLGVYLTITILSKILFKRTAQQSFPPLRFLFGLGGGVVALAMGLVFVSAAVLGVRLYGTLMEPRIVGAPPGAKVPAWVAGLVWLKQSFEEGVAGSLIPALDPIPKETYATTNSLGRVLSDQAAMQRFFQTPELKGLVFQRKIMALQGDKDFLDAAKRGDYLAMLRNPSFVEAANDPEVARQLSGTNFRKALDSALAPASPPR